jgi:hypothetical protein
VLLRLLVSAAVACSLLVVVIAFGMRTLQSGLAPLPGAGTGEPGAPVDMPLYRAPLDAPRFTERDVAALRDYLAVSPADRLAAALAESDARFLGVNGFTLLVPSVADAPRAIREGRVNTIPGTTENAISEEHADLVSRATRYAGAYNALLLRRGVE